MSGRVSLTPKCTQVKLVTPIVARRSPRAIPQTKSLVIPHCTHVLRVERLLGVSLLKKLTRPIPLSELPRKRRSLPLASYPRRRMVILSTALARTILYFLTKTLHLARKDLKRPKKTLADPVDTNTAKLASVWYGPVPLKLSG